MVYARRPGETESPSWDNLIETAPGDTLQHQTFWLKLSGKVCDCRPAVWGVFKGREFIGGCTLLEDALASVAKGAPCTQYNGLVFSNSKSIKAYRQEMSALVMEEALAKQSENHYRLWL